MFSKIFSESWSFFSAHFVAICCVLLPFALPVDFLLTLNDAYFVDDSTPFLRAIGPSLVSLAISAIWTAALIFYIASAVGGEPLAIKRTWQLGLEYWLPMVITLVLMYVAVFAGLMLFIVPGIWIGIKLSFAFFEVLLANRTPIEAIKQSWNLTTGHGGKIFAGAFAVFGPVYLLYIGTAVTIPHGSGSYLFAYTLLSTVSVLLGAFYTVFLYRIYWIAREDHQDEPGQTEI